MNNMHVLSHSITGVKIKILNGIGIHFFNKIIWQLLSMVVKLNSLVSSPLLIQYIKHSYYHNVCVCRNDFCDVFISHLPAMYLRADICSGVTHFFDVMI